MTEPTNLDRAARVAALLDQYADAHDKGSEPETVLTDVLADLMHWADAYGVDFRPALWLATEHHAAEVNGE